MAFPETNTPKRDPYGNAMRDPTGTDPHAHYNYWNWILGLVVAGLVAFYVFSSMTGTPQAVNNTSTSQPVAPAATAPETPKNP